MKKESGLWIGILFSMVGLLIIWGIQMIGFFLIRLVMGHFENTETILINALFNVGPGVLSLLLAVLGFRYAWKRYLLYRRKQ